MLYRVGQKILDECGSTFNEQGEEIIRLNKPLDDYLEETDGYQQRRAKRLLFPHKSPDVVPNRDSRSDDDLVQSWCDMLVDRSGAGATAWQQYPEAMQAARKLVELTRLVLLDEASEGWETGFTII